ncbi:MAG: NAD(+)/NADH kinase [Thioalkalivibrionaceae bacterium]
MIEFRRIGLTGKPDDPRVRDVLQALWPVLTAASAQVWIDTTLASLAATLKGVAPQTATLTNAAAQTDLLIVIGGDGSFLSCARAVHGTRTALFGVNLGRLGFLVDVPPESAAADLEHVLAGRGRIESRALIEARIERDGVEIFTGHALNDAALHVAGVVRVLEFDLTVDGLDVARMRADGIVFSTPTGSTAYALSAGGPIVTPHLDALVVVPICPHGLSHRPLVLNGDCAIECRLSPGSRSSAQLALDGRDNIDFGGQDRLTLGRSQARVQFVHPPNHHFLQTLRRKLRWAEHP